MKKFFVSALLFAVTVSAYAHSAADTVAMTIAGKPVSIDEFLFTAKKNGETDLSDKKNLKAFVELFENYKLKVADAEAEGLDKTDSFKEELDKYRSQLISDYLSDRAGEEKVLSDEYARLNEVLDLTHILFFLPQQTVSKDTVAVYQQALAAYQRIQQGEDILKVGAELAKKDSAHVGYEQVRSFFPMRTVKAFEDYVYQMPEGAVSMPIRTKFGFHIVKLNRRIPNPGRRQVSHILIPFAQDSVTRTEEETYKLAEEVYQKGVEGNDFAELAKKYSADKASAQKGGLLPVFGLGEMVAEFEQAAFAIKNPGDISQPVKTRFGYHIIKLEKNLGIQSFDEIKKSWYRQMSQGEWNFALHQSFDDRMKKEYNFVFHPEAYAELQAICNDYFPTDPKFFEQAKDLNKELMRIDTVSFAQNEFAAYIQRCPFSVKTYAGDFMKEVLDLCIHDVLSSMERKNLPTKYPEYKFLLNEYRDGTLLFAISNQKIWNKPAEEQAQLEADWIKELKEKYPVEVNWKALEKAVKK